MEELVLPVCSECEEEMDAFCPDCGLCMACCNETDCTCEDVIDLLGSEDDKE